MHYLDESVVAECVDAQVLMPYIESMFVRMSESKAVNFPVVRERLMSRSAVFGIKSGFDATGPRLGIKVGGFWPENAARGELNHQSTVLLLDTDTGAPYALVRGNLLTALRTAASSAISVKYLARQSARTLGVLGAGAQSRAQVEAVLQQRPFTRVFVSDLEPDRSHRLTEALSPYPVEVHCCAAEEMAQSSDVIITLTPSTRAVLQSGWIRPGTHLCCVGTDTRGKQEIDEQVFRSARTFCDERTQSVTIGECQHAVAAKLVSASDITEIGDVIAGTREGRTSDDDVTIYDSTGVGLQDVVAASVALDVALERKIATDIG